MATKLRVIPAQGAPFEVPISYTATVGRTPESTVCLRFNPTVSRQHAIIRCHNGFEYQLIDLGSRNGTYVNDRKVVLPVPLQNGARIRIANIEMIFEQEPESQGGIEDAATLAGSTDQTLETDHNAAILVCDIRGFSAQAEVLPAAIMAQFLGQWFRAAGNAMQKNTGVVDKFIGDAVLAYWRESPEPGLECGSAHRSACQLLDLAAGLRWPGSGKPFTIAIALHFGSVAFGNIGLVAQRDATIIGNAVNTAFRLEALTKELGQTVLVSDALLTRLPEADRGRFADLGRKSVKGKCEVLQVFGWAG